ncbi:hypothetical protein MBLNU457_7157t1 [Dothideomycetes sp. NU457]
MSVNLSSQWRALGPFQMGTREATWGADPLEVHGGFMSLQYDPEQHFTSSLTNNASVGWSTIEATSHDTTSTSCEVKLTCNSTNEFDYEQMTYVYGWTSLQYQAWIRGNLTVTAAEIQTIILYIDQVLELYVDGEHHFGGDVYNFRRAPLVLRLDPGPHQLDLRLVRDVRAMSGVGSPTIEVAVRAEITTPGLSAHNVLMPDCLTERNDFASSYGSVMVRNDHQQDLEIVALRPSGNNLSMTLVNNGPIQIVPGQTRPIAFEIESDSSCPKSVSFDIQYKALGDHDPIEHMTVTKTVVKRKSIYEPHKITYLHPGGIVSKAVIQAPVGEAATASILLQLHGSGVDPEWPSVAESLASLNLHAWTVFPSGVTPWTGDDWHQWGSADVKAAVSALPAWIERNKWTEGPAPALDSWMVTGHSNGGQGVWYTMTHQPDSVFAGAPVAGYSSIQNYVSYDLWQPMDPSIRSVLDGSLATYRHELLVSNLQGISIHSQHGRADDNVPVFHARLMKHLLSQAGLPLNYTEIPGKGHVFDGMMSTDPLKQFYTAELDRNHTRPTSSLNFTLTVGRPADTGPMYGVQVHSLKTPGRLGKVSVSLTPQMRSNTCKIRTTNIRKFSVPWSDQQCLDLQIDGQTVRLEEDDPRNIFLQDSDRIWRNAEDDEHMALDEKISISQFGGMDNILRTKGRFCIQADKASRKIALQISRNLCQYYYADTEILPFGEIPLQCGNTICVLQRPWLDLTRSPGNWRTMMDSGQSSLSIKDFEGNTHTYTSEDGLGAIYLDDQGPGEPDLWVWGSNARGLEIAARLVPMLTGVGQPDFIVADKAILEQGAGGVLAMGFFMGLAPDDLTASMNSYFT